VPPEQHVLPLLDLFLEIYLDPPGEVSLEQKAREYPVMLFVDRREVKLQKEERRQARMEARIVTREIFVAYLIQTLRPVD